MRWLRSMMVAGCVLALALAQPRGMAQGDDLQARAPKVIYIMRHAEKPTLDKDPDLAPQGFRRAQALPALFVAMPGRTTRPPLLRPDVIFASAPSRHSNRPIETVTPLAQMLHERINADYADVETEPLARQVLSGRYAGKVVLISWHHGEIPQVAKALGVEDAPRKWDPDVFDQVWKIEYVDGHAQLTVLHEHLLPGDAQ